MDSENAVFGRKIRRVREHQGLTREKLAELSGISTQFLAEIENGKKGMSALTLKKICSALCVSADSVIFADDTSANPEIVEMLSRIPKEKEAEIQKIIELLIKLV